MKNIFAKILILIIFLAQSVTVCHAQALLKKDIVPQIEKIVTEQLQKKGYKSVNVTIVNVPFLQLDLPNGKITYKISSNSQNVMARSFLNVAIYVNNNFAKTVGIPVKISALKDVYVAKETIGRSACLTPNLLQVKTIDVTNTFVYPLEYGELNKEYVTTKVFPAGTIIDKKYLKSKPDIMKDSVVTMYFKSQNDLYITLDGVAVSEGNVGEMVAVRNKKYNRIYSGKIVGENKVLIQI